MRNYFVFDGHDSRDYGVYISGSGVYNAPERAYEAIQVPGRNGDLVIDYDRLANIEITYPAFISSDFNKNMEAFRSMLLSVRGYAELYDSYHPDEYRMAYFYSGIEVTARSQNDAGEFEIVFACKPQRFLRSGQIVQTVGEWGPVETASGKIGTFENDGTQDIKTVIADVDPVQDFHGYGHAWYGGWSKNKLEITNANTSVTIHGVTFTVRDDGTIMANGTADAAYHADFVINTAFNYAEETILTGCPADAGDKYAIRTDYGYVDSGSGATIPANFNHSIYIRVYMGKTADHVIFRPMARPSSVSDDTFVPYVNECPISGREDIIITRAGQNLLNVNGEVSHTVTTPSSVNLEFTSDDNYVYVSGFNYYANVFYRVGFYVTLEPGTYYIRSFILDGDLYGDMQMRLEDYNGRTLVQYVQNGENTFTLDSAMRCEILINPTKDTVCEGCKIGVVISQNPGIDEYVTFADSDTYTVNWENEAGEIYGGTFNTYTGKLTAKYKCVDMGSLSWIVSPLNRNGRFKVNISDKKPGRTLWSDIYGVMDNYSEPAVYDGYIGSDNTKNVYVNDPRFGMDADAYKTAVTGHQLVYELETPVVYDLTPVQIDALTGQNNIWTDSGNVSVEYSQNPWAVVNPTPFDSKPLIKITGYGDLVIGDETITVLNQFDDVTVDCELEDCTHGSDNANAYVSFSGNDFPRFKPGVSAVSYDNTITEVEITPRWYVV